MHSANCAPAKIRGSTMGSTGARGPGAYRSGATTSETSGISASEWAPRPGLSSPRDPVVVEEVPGNDVGMAVGAAAERVRGRGRESRVQLEVRGEPARQRIGGREREIVGGMEQGRLVHQHRGQPARVVGGQADAIEGLFGMDAVLDG